MNVTASRSNRNYCIKVCTSELSKKCSLEKRSIIAPKFGKNKSTELFTVFHSAFYKIETVKGVRRFAGININKETTHIFITLWRLALKDIDAAGEYFLRRMDKLYRIIDVTNVDEHNRYVIFQAVQRGLDSKEESNA